MSFKRFLKRCLIALLMLGGVAVLALGYWYTRLTVDISPAGVQKPDPMDAKEAEKKLKLFDQALQAGRPGFIRLTEVELNSYAAAQFFPESSGQAATNNPAGTQLLKCRADLTQRHITWYSWVQRDFHGLQFSLVWTRSFRLQFGRGRWLIETTAMRLGDVDIPARFWPHVQHWLGDADQAFLSKSNWFQAIPALELRPHEFSQSPELRLYTYADTNALLRAKP